MAETWKDRLRENITLTSPLGVEFTASWVGNPVNITNSINSHKFPGIDGVKIGTNGANGFVYPLTIIFDGDDNDINSNNFMSTLAAESKDKWTIIHPVLGEKILTWTSASEEVQPITSGNITVVNTEWVESLEDSSVESLEQVQALAEAQADTANDAAAEQFFRLYRFPPTSGEKFSLLSAIGKFLNAVKTGLRTVANFELIDPAIFAIIAAIENLEAEATGAIDSLVGQVQTLVQLFGLGQESSVDSVVMYSDFADEILEVTPDNANSEGLITLAFTELVASAALVGAGKSALIGGITNRNQALTAATKLSSMLDNITKKLDDQQARYKDQTIDLQYFSQTQSYADNVLMSSYSNRFLLLSLYGLASERTIILDQDKSTPQIVSDEYGTILDGNLEKFLISNELKGDDNYLLKAGREVLIYQ